MQCRRSAIDHGTRIGRDGFAKSYALHACLSARFSVRNLSRWAKALEINLTISLRSSLRRRANEVLKPARVVVERMKYGSTVEATGKLDKLASDSSRKLQSLFLMIDHCKPE